MSKIDLTAAELREFARLWESDTVSDHERDIVRKCLGRIMDRVPAISSLSLALADAMEERDKARDDLEAAREKRNSIARFLLELNLIDMGSHYELSSDDGERLEEFQNSVARAAWESKP